MALRAPATRATKRAPFDERATMPAPGTCDICKKLKNEVQLKQRHGVAACSGCNKRELAPREPCSSCRKVAIVSFRLDGDRPLCQLCYKAQILVAACHVCHRVQSVHERDARGRPICNACYSREHKDVCAICGKVGRVSCRGEDGQAICTVCYRREIYVEPCARCGRTKSVVA